MLHLFVCVGIELTLGLLHRLTLVAQAQGTVFPLCTYVMVIDALSLFENVRLIPLFIGSPTSIPDTCVSALVWLGCFGWVGGVGTWDAGLSARRAGHPHDE